MKDSKGFWDKSARRYAKGAVRNEADYQKKLALTQEYLQKDWSVLEFGCGTGSTAIVHAPHVNNIIATDISTNMLSIAEDKTRDAGIENLTFKQGTLDSIELDDESFDAVLGLNILHLLEDVDSAISKVYRLLKPGGIFVSSTVLVGEVNFAWRLLIPIMQAVNFAPYVNRFDKQEFLSKLTAAGFTIDLEWQPGKETIFVVAKKPI